MSESGNRGFSCRDRASISERGVRLHLTLAIVLFALIFLSAGVGQSALGVPKPGNFVLAALLATALLALAASFGETRRFWRALFQQVTVRLRTWMAGSPIPINSLDLFLATPTPSLLVDCKTLRIIQSNPAALALYGYTAPAFRCLRVSDLCAKAAHPLDGFNRCLLTGLDGIRGGLAEHLRSDGSALRVETNVQRTSFNGHEVWLITVSDVTARIELAKLLEASEHHHRELIDQSLGMVFTHDLEGNLESVNPAFAQGLGYAENEVIGRNIADFILPEQRAPYAAYLNKIAVVGSDANSAHMLHRNGERRIWEYRNRVRTSADGSQHVMCCAIDVSERRKYEHDLIEQSRKDPLTGCYNRRYFEIFEARATVESHWACVVVDVDHFKQYNDSKGHHIGDLALIDTARFLESLLRGDDAVVRFGGDEFVLLIKHCSEQGIAVLTSRLREAIQHHAPVPISYGIAARARDESLRQTIHRADTAMIEGRAMARAKAPLER